MKLSLLIVVPEQDQENNCSRRLVAMHQKSWTRTIGAYTIRPDRTRVFTKVYHSHIVKISYQHVAGVNCDHPSHCFYLPRSSSIPWVCYWWSQTSPDAWDAQPWNSFWRQRHRTTTKSTRFSQALLQRLNQDWENIKDDLWGKMQGPFLISWNNSSVSYLAASLNYFYKRPRLTLLCKSSSRY